MAYTCGGGYVFLTRSGERESMSAINFLHLLWLTCIVQQAMAMNATSVVPNIVAIDNLSPVTSELSLLRLAEHVGPVQVALCCTLFYFCSLLVIDWYKPHCFWLSCCTVCKG